MNHFFPLIYNSTDLRYLDWFFVAAFFIQALVNLPFLFPSSSKLSYELGNMGGWSPISDGRHRILLLDIQFVMVEVFNSNVFDGWSPTFLMVDIQIFQIQKLVGHPTVDSCHPPFRQSSQRLPGRRWSPICWIWWPSASAIWCGCYRMLTWLTSALENPKRYLGVNHD